MTRRRPMATRRPTDIGAPNWSPDPMLQTLLRRHAEQVRTGDGLPGPEAAERVDRMGEQLGRQVTGAEALDLLEADRADHAHRLAAWRDAHHL